MTKIIKRHKRGILFIILIGLIVFECSKETSQTTTNNTESAMKSLTYKDSNLSYIESGNGDTTLLFVHGSFLNKEYWNSQIKFFSPRYKVIAIDLPGHGDSGKGSDSLKIQNFGNALVYFTKELKLNNLILIGHSFGADIVLEAAVKYPEPIVGIIAVDYFKNVGTPLPQATQDQVLASLKADFKKTVNGYLHQGLVTPATDSAVVKRVEKDYKSMEPAGGSQSIADQFSYTKREADLLSKVNLKVHVLNVDYMPTNEEALKKSATSGYELTTIHGTSHFPMIEDPDQFDATLQKIITQIGK